MSCPVGQLDIPGVHSEPRLELLTLQILNVRDLALGIAFIMINWILSVIYSEWGELNAKE